MDRSIRYIWLFTAIILFLNLVLSHPINSEAESEALQSETDDRQNYGGGHDGYHHGGHDGYHHGGHDGYHHGGHDGYHHGGHDGYHHGGHDGYHHGGHGRK